MKSSAGKPYFYVFSTAWTDRPVEVIRSQEQIKTQMCYTGPSEYRAGLAFYKACKAALRDPKCFEVVTWRGSETVARVRLQEALPTMV